VGITVGVAYRRKKLAQHKLGLDHVVGPPLQERFKAGIRWDVFEVWGLVSKIIN